nr:tripartite tricarboxylate transporter substrate binding protein [Rhodoferax sp.]
ELDIYIWSSIVAPAGTLDATISRLNTESVKALRSTEIRDKWFPVGFEPMPSTPEECARFAQAESRRWAEAVKISGFKAAE